MTPVVIQRREFLKKAACGIVLAASMRCRGAAGIFTNLYGSPFANLDSLLAEDWLARWEKNILNEARTRYCD